jgi:hypothetical protein
MRYSPTRKPLLPRGKLLLENLEDRTVPAIILPGPGLSGPVQLVGAAAGDQLLIRLVPTQTPSVIFGDGHVFKTEPLANITAIYVNGIGSGNTLTIDHGTGFLAKTSGLPIYVDGGGASNHVIIQGGLGQHGFPVSESYAESSVPVGTGVPSRTNGMVLTSTLGIASQTLYLTNITGVADALGAKALTVIASDHDDSINISNGAPLGSATTMLIQATSPSVGDVFVPITFANKAYMELDGSDANTTFVMNVAAIPTGLGSMYIEGGKGYNTLYIKSMPAGMNCTWDNIQVVFGGGPAPAGGPSQAGPSAVDAAFAAWSSGSSSTFGAVPADELALGLPNTLF